MKNFMLSPEGLKQISDIDLVLWRAHGSFMNSEGPTTIPMRLSPEDVEVLEKLMSVACNFVYWMTPDFRVIFVTKDGAIDNGGLFWKVRFEWRGVGKDGKAGVSGARFERKVAPKEVLPAVEAAIAQFVTAFAQKPEGAGSAEGTPPPPPPTERSQN